MRLKIQKLKNEKFSEKVLEKEKHKRESGEVSVQAEDLGRHGCLQTFFFFFLVFNLFELIIFFNKNIILYCLYVVAG